jgi:dTDP-4-amino-4,6-dideoxygalactose transaminase
MYHDVGCYLRRERQPASEPLFCGMNFRMPELAAALLRPQLETLDRQLENRKAQRRAVIERLSNLTPSRHNDPESACGVTFSFDDPEDATEFGKARGVDVLIGTGRHVYTNWQSILGMRSAHPKLDPYSWAQRKIEQTTDQCPKTLEILARTCSVKLLPHVPKLVYRAAIEMMARHANSRPRRRPTPDAPRAAFAPDVREAGA